MVRRIVQLGALALLLAARPAAADMYSVGARTEAQAYQFRSWAGRAWNDPGVISRYRLVQYLDLGAFDLTSSKDAERIDFVSSLRLEHDFGFDQADIDRLDTETQPTLHLLFAYLQWQNALNGLLDLRLGRQIRFDELEFYSFDGLDVHVHTPAYLGVGVFGGWQVKGTSILGSPTFAPDGVRMSDRRRIGEGATTDLTANPASSIAYDYLDAPSPIFGARLVLENVRNVDAQLVYRRAMSKTEGENLEALPEAARGWQVDVEHAGAGLRVRPIDRLSVYGSADRDLYRDRWAALRAGTKVDVIPYRLTITAEAQSWNPTFDADSIWNIFATGARDEYELRADARVGDLQLYAGPLLTVYHLNLGEDYAEAVGIVADGQSLLYGGLAGFSTAPEIPWRIAADAIYRGGPSGERGHPDTLGREFWFNGLIGRNFRERYALDLRLSVANVSDPNAPGLEDLWSLGTALIGRIGLSEEATLTLIVEENTNRLVTSDLRGYAVLDVRTMFR